MAQRQGVGNTNVQTPDLETIFKYALVGALIVSFGDVVIQILTNLDSSESLRLADQLEWEIGDIFAQTTLFVGFVLVYRWGGSTDSLVKAVGITYVGAFVHDLVGVVLRDWEITISGLIANVHDPIVIVAFAMIVRLLNGQTILPGVDVRL